MEDKESITLTTEEGVPFLIDKEDYDIIKSFKWHILIRNYRKGTKYLYAYDKNTQKTVRVHRLVLNLTDKNILVDHINGDTFDNRKCNLRTCTIAQNRRNSKKSEYNRVPTSKYKGVQKRGNRWLAEIGYNSKKIYLGYFDTETDAAEAYNEAAIKYHKEFAKLNIIGE